MTPRRALWALIVVSAAFRLAWACCLGPGNDEAYHYLYTVHRDWSYFDHPPMVALVEGVGLALSGGAVTATALRLGFIALFAGSTWLMARLGARFFGPWAGVWAAVALNATAYYGLAAGTFALPDGPLLFFWLLTLDRLAAALERPDRLRPWLWVGLAWGGAMLSKYHAVFLPAGVLTLASIDPDARRRLRRPGPYLALAVGALAFTPVLAWNAANGWASFAFQGGRAVGVPWPRPDRLAAFLAGQAAYLLPWMWLLLLGALWRRRRAVLGEGAPADRFLIAFALPPLAAFTLVASFRSVLPHWSLVGFLPVLALLGADWAARQAREPRRSSRRVAFALGFVVVGASIYAAQARWGFLQGNGRGRLPVLAVPHDPTVDMSGWDLVADELRRRGLVDEPGTFLFTGKWYHSGQLAFALDGAADVLCYRAGAGSHGFGQWSEPEDWVGRDGILLVVNHSSTEPEAYDRWFERIDPIGAFDVLRAGGAIRTVRLYRCVRQTKPFPFDDREREPQDEDEVGDRRKPRKKDQDAPQPPPRRALASKRGHAEAAESLQ